MTKIRTYSELSKLETFELRYYYLKMNGIVGKSSWGFDRWINQVFYRSHEWKTIKNQVIVRDNGCDLGVPGFEIHSGLLVRHMNPMTLDQIKHGDEGILDPEFLITTSLQTHNAIHFGDDNLLPRGPITRRSGDTTLW